jgi:alcohol dehydrogenase class IV
VLRGRPRRGPIESVATAAERAASHGVDGLVALGGGSVSVTGRAVAIAVGEGGDLVTLATHRDENGRFVSPRLDTPKVPIVVLPTTPSTAYGKAGTPSPFAARPRGWRCSIRRRAQRA